MQFTIAAITLFAGAALAIPAQLDSRQVYIPCSGLYGNAQCCSVNVLGVADLDCANPATTPQNATDFSAICALTGQRAECCAIPIANQDVLCQTPTGVSSA